MDTQKQIGLWVDHRRAVMVYLNGKESHVKEIYSNVEKHTRPSGGSRTKTPYGPQDIVAEDNRERRFQNHLREYFDEIIADLSATINLHSIYIFGPGQAKLELQKRIKSKGLENYIIEIETADKMTDPQISAKVRDFFKKSSNSKSQKNK